MIDTSALGIFHGAQMMHVRKQLLRDHANMKDGEAFVDGFLTEQIAFMISDPENAEILRVQLAYEKEALKPNADGSSPEVLVML